MTSPLERGLLRPLPAEPFATGLTLTPRVDRYARVTVRQCQYSVPAQADRARSPGPCSRASEVLIFDGRRQVARHERADRPGRPVADPGPLPGGAAAQTRARCPARPRWSRPAPRARSPRRTRRSGPPPARPTATRPAPGPLVEVLLLHRHLPAGDVVAGMTVALRLQNPSADVVAVEARNADSRPDPGPLSLVLPRVKSRDSDDRHGDDVQQVTVLPPDPRPLPTVAAYDQLLTLDARPRRADGLR